MTSHNVVTILRNYKHWKEIIDIHSDKERDTVLTSHVIVTHYNKSSMWHCSQDFIGRPTLLFDYNVIIRDTVSATGKSKKKRKIKNRLNWEPSLFCMFVIKLDQHFFIAAIFQYGRKLYFV